MRTAVDCAAGVELYSGGENERPATSSTGLLAVDFGRSVRFFLHVGAVQVGITLVFVFLSARIVLANFCIRFDWDIKMI